MTSQKYCLPLVACFMIIHVHAQQNFSLGMKGGINIPNLTASGSSPVSNGYKSRLDGDAALFVEWPVENNFSLQAQLEYSAQGGKKNGSQAFAVPATYQSMFPAGQVPDYLYANYKSEAKLNYLMLPVQAKFFFPIARHWRAYLAGGPFVSYLLNAHNLTSGSSIIYLDAAQSQPLVNESQHFDDKENIRNDLHQVNAGLAGNIGLMYRTGRNGLFAEAGGNYGFFDIQKNGGDGRNKTGAALFSIGYQYRL